MLKRFLLLSAAAAAAAVSPCNSKSPSLAFAGSVLPSIPRTTAISSIQSSFVGSLGQSIVAVEEAKGDSATSLYMSCRRNLKKEKRLRNEICARQYRKPKSKFRGSRPGRNARAMEEDADSEWLSQIYGQHTIYRRDEKAVSSPAEKTGGVEAKQAVAA
ncbi:hypothetical protein GUITHDRAFT_154277 [Guillardia theta CCMP2712]|uniref:Uncharacterized protein n=2 Tax=Guillardia theta TaxID=55529 RepID=L1IUS3_GUITC|nr:hypothetical protein GUITHDRAFT_154277 [Guillardia theta CCMP2712]EKX39983.1 hypothetical protein GUITHDRAFT_154277 [Guillardia theta CCMP2712]|mmetsp:Transcript_5098/g.18305  ORF Transcript_5098/g.18305 Transcript_5098/m.18305 type:complete len:159 (+) Transcript_5098:130-606(+)|eukprot:XP_005826963.1 hypothetical protein GUITHDRAFT_154277 [Guillardia theta CCMP2712]